FFQSAYYQTYYLGAGAVEDVYYILDLGPTEKLSICLYNGLSASRYSDAQVAALAGLAPPVLELARQFCAGRADLSPNPQADLAPRLQEVLRGFGRDVLTDREREACHLLLSGHSAKSSARLMDISPETVRMHRKNLYTKLEVGSQSELFALFIECLSQGQRVGP
ncbi:LuxR C-terminal-related transcriptional regulator, partial [Pseudomonas aeruginosa]|nr:LuxR C-terminal-related transcriptional regulator [Pseudomonas aeruginosa]